MPVKVPVVQTGLERSIEAAAQRAGKSLRLNVQTNPRSLEALQQPLGRLTGQADEFSKSLAAANARVIAFGAAVGVIGAVTTGFKELVQTTIEVEKSLAKINSILQVNNQALSGLKDQLFDIAKETEQTFDTVAEAALELSRQGLGAEEILVRLKDAMILTRLSGISAADAVAGLTAAVNSFTIEGLTTSEVLNKISNAANQFAVSERDLIEGFKRSASVAQQAGVSINELGGIITAVQQRTARGGAVIGNSFKTIFTRIGRVENLELLQQLGVQVTDLEGRILPATRLLEGLAQELKNLNDLELRQVTEKIGGGFQIAPLIAALQDYSDENSIAIRATKAFESATDEAYKKNIALNQTLSALINQTVISLKELANTLGEIGVTDNLKKIIGFFGGVVSKLQEIFDGEGLGSSLARGIIKGLGAVISGPGLAIVAAIVLKLLVDLSKFGVLSLKTFFGLNKTAKQVATTQAQIAGLLQQDSSIRKRILAIENSSLSVEQKRLLQAKFFTDALNTQAAILARMQSIAKNISPAVFAGTRVSVAPSAKTGRSAGGFLPINAEKADIAKGVGGAPASAKPVVIPNFSFGKGQKGTMVANTSEYIVPNYAGGGDAIFNQNMVKGMGLPSNAKAIKAAGGFIPNFAKKNRNAYVFDFDDTLAVTKAKSFQDFNNPSFIKSASATRYTSLARLRAKRGDDIYVVTARLESPKITSAISNFMKGIGAPAKGIIAVGGMFKGEKEPGKRPGTMRGLKTSSKKAKVLSRLTSKYNSITFLDDDIENVLKASKIKGVKARQALSSKLFKKAAKGYIPNFAGDKTTVRDAFQGSKNYADGLKEVQRLIKEGRIKYNYPQKTVTFGDQSTASADQIRLGVEPLKKAAQKQKAAEKTAVTDKKLSTQVIIDAQKKVGVISALGGQEGGEVYSTKSISEDTKSYLKRRLGGKDKAKIGNVFIKGLAFSDPKSFFKADEIAGRELKLRKRVQAYFKKPLVNFSKSILPQFFGGVNDKDVRDLARKITPQKAANAFTSGVEGSLFESAVKIALNKDNFAAVFNNPEQEPFDFEENRNIQQASLLNKTFFPNTPVARADAKRSINREAIVTFISKIARANLKTGVEVYRPDKAQTTGKKSLIPSTPTKAGRTPRAAKGYIPNFANYVFDSDKLNRKTANTILKSILATRKKKDLIIAPAGVGKSTLARKLGKFISSPSDVQRAGSFTILSGAGKTKKGLFSANLAAIIDAVNESGGKVSYLYAKNADILARRRARISQDPTDLRSTAQLRGTLRAPLNQFDFVQGIKRTSSRFNILKSGAKGYVPNFTTTSSNPLQDAINREVSSGISINQVRINQKGSLRNSQNPLGLAVTNTRDEPTGAIPAAKGYVPNYAGLPLPPPRRIRTPSNPSPAPPTPDPPTPKGSRDLLGAIFGLQIALTGLQGATEGVEGGFAKATNALAGFTNIGVTTLFAAQGLKTFGDTIKEGSSGFSKKVGGLVSKFGPWAAAVGGVVAGFLALRKSIRLNSDENKEASKSLAGLSDAAKKSAERLGLIRPGEQRRIASELQEILKTKQQGEPIAIQRARRERQNRENRENAQAQASERSIPPAPILRARRERQNRENRENAQAQASERSIQPAAILRARRERQNRNRAEKALAQANEQSLTSSRKEGRKAVGIPEEKIGLGDIKLGELIPNLREDPKIKTDRDEILSRILRTRNPEFLLGVLEKLGQLDLGDLKELNRIATKLETEAEEGQKSFGENLRKIIGSLNPEERIATLKRLIPELQAGEGKELKSIREKGKGLKIDLGGKDLTAGLKSVIAERVLDETKRDVDTGKQNVERLRTDLVKERLLAEIEVSKLLRGEQVNALTRQIDFLQGIGSSQKTLIFNLEKEIKLREFNNELLNKGSASVEKTIESLSNINFDEKGANTAVKNLKTQLEGIRDGLKDLSPGDDPTPLLDEYLDLSKAILDFGGKNKNVNNNTLVNLTEQFAKIKSLFEIRKRNLGLDEESKTKAFNFNKELDKTVAKYESITKLIERASLAQKGLLERQTTQNLFKIEQRLKGDPSLAPNQIRNLQIQQQREEIQQRLRSVEIEQLGFQLEPNIIRESEKVANELLTRKEKITITPISKETLGIEDSRSALEKIILELQLKLENDQDLDKFLKPFDKALADLEITSQGLSNEALSATQDFQNLDKVVSEFAEEVAKLSRQRIDPLITLINPASLKEIDLQIKALQEARKKAEEEFGEGAIPDSAISSILELERLERSLSDRFKTNQFFNRSDLQLASEFKDTIVGASETFVKNMADAMANSIFQADSLKEALLNAALEFAKSIARQGIENLLLGNSSLNPSRNTQPQSGGGGLGGFIRSIFGFNTGGKVYGGSGSKDDVPAMLTGGEFVINKQAVNKYGENFFKNLNQGRVQAFANGGSVLPIQDRRDGFVVPGTFGQGAIRGRRDLLAFATQEPTFTSRDTITDFGAFLGPQSARLTQFGRRESQEFQDVQSAKRQAFDLFASETEAKKEAKRLEKEYKKNFKNSLINAVVGPILSYGLGQLGKSFSLGAKTEIANLGEGASFSDKVGAFFRGGFSGGKTGAGGKFTVGGISNIFSKDPNVSPLGFDVSNAGKAIIEGSLGSDRGSLGSQPSSSTFIESEQPLLGSPTSTSTSDLTPLQRQYLGEILPPKDWPNQLLRAAGGFIPNTAGIDTIPAMLSGGEFVMNSTATRKIGSGQLEALNAGANFDSDLDFSQIVSKLEELIKVSEKTGDINITINNENSEITEESGDANQKNRELSQKIKTVVKQVINEEKRLGGQLRNRG